MVDWGKLKVYAKSQYRSFEELCYHVAKTLYDDQGHFTSIDYTGNRVGVGPQWDAQSCSNV